MDGFIERRRDFVIRTLPDGLQPRTVARAKARKPLQLRGNSLYSKGKTHLTRNRWRWDSNPRITDLQSVPRLT